MSTESNLSDMPLDESRLNHLLGYLLARAATPLRRAFFEKIGEPYGLRPVEFTILMLISTNEDVTLKRLTRALSVTAPNITVVLDRLEARGLVKRVRSQRDRRSMNIHLLEDGQTMLEQMLQISRTMEAGALSMLDAGEREMLAALLRKLVQGTRG